jgi:hypothetical protein
LIEKLETAYDVEFFESILNFCMKGENILMHELVCKLVSIIFDEVDTKINENIERA